MLCSRTSSSPEEESPSTLIVEDTVAGVGGARLGEGVPKGVELIEGRRAGAEEGALQDSIKRKKKGHVNVDTNPRDGVENKMPRNVILWWYKRSL